MRSGMRGENMEMIFQWIRSLVFYLILMTMIANLLPDKKYENYLRLFAGVIFLMLVFSPFGNLTGVEEQAAEAFSRLTFQNEARVLKREIEDVDGARMEKLMDRYRETIENELRRMVEELGGECRNVVVRLDEELEGGTFGRVMAVEMTVSQAKIVASNAEGTVLREESAAAGFEMSHSEAEMVAKLMDGIGAYYGVEEGNIAIHLENE